MRISFSLSVVLLVFLVAITVSYASSLLVVGNVPDARVEIDESAVGVTDTNGRAYVTCVSPGAHLLTLSKEGYTTFSDSVHVDERLTTQVEVTLALLDETPPEIRILSPVSSRGVKPVLKEEMIVVSGLTRDNSRVASVRINDSESILSKPTDVEIQAFPGNTLRFQGDVPLNVGNNPIRIEAWDIWGNHADTLYTVERRQSIVDSLNMKFYALLIGVDEYDHWNDLNNPVDDMETLAEELEKYYGFETDIVRNPTKEEVITSIRSYNSRKFSEYDELLIALAGHGYYDEVSGNGYFIAKDGERVEDDPNFLSYINYPELQNIISNINCEHILLMLDACFAGTFVDHIAAGRGDEKVYDEMSRGEFILEGVAHRTRLMLSSTEREYGSDGLPEKHSPFMRVCLDGLIQSHRGRYGVLTVHDLRYHYMQGLNPRPVLTEFRGNEPGSTFLFIVQ